MKKLLVILAMGALASCGGGSESTEATVDSSATKSPDTTTMAPAPAPDTTAAKVDTTKAVDTTKK